MALTHITTHVADALARLPEQYKGKPRMEALITALVTPVQELEDSMWDVWANRVLNGNPTGDLLAKLGHIVGQANLTGSDAEFLIFIKARIPTNKSDGRKRTMIRIASILIDDGSINVVGKTIPSSTFYLEPQGPVSVDPYIMYDEFLSKAIGAGVRLVFVWTVVALNATLIFGDSSSSFTPGSGQLLSDSSGAFTGGKLGGTV